MPLTGKNPLLPAAHAMYRMRRTVATSAAIVLALVFGWHAFFGQNGITAYAQKRAEDRALQVQIKKLSDENSTLTDKVDHLQTDPDTIEMEARQRLHYTRPGEVIYTLNGQPKADDAVPPAHR